MSDRFRKEHPHVKQQTVSTLLRAKGYIVPNYCLPEGVQDVDILRVVVRESMSADLLEGLVRDLLGVAETLMGSDRVELEGFAVGKVGRVEKDRGSLGEKELGRLERRGTLRTVC